MKTIQNCNLSECFICQKPTSTVIEHGVGNGLHRRRFYLCEHHLSKVEYVRVTEVINQKKLKFDRRTKKYIKIIDNNKSIVSFRVYFRELGIKHCGKYIWLKKEISPRYRTSLHVYPDERQIMDYLLDNPPFNANGKQYQTVKRINKWHRGDRRYEIQLTNKYSVYHTKDMCLATAYLKLLGRKTEVIQKVGPKQIVTLNSETIIKEVDF